MEGKLGNIMIRKELLSYQKIIKNTCTVGRPFIQVDLLPLPLVKFAYLKKIVSVTQTSDVPQAVNVSKMYQCCFFVL